MHANLALSHLAECCLHGVLHGICLQGRAAERITLTSLPEEVSAAATVLQLRPYMCETLLAAALEENDGQEAVH